MLFVMQEKMIYPGWVMNLQTQPPPANVEVLELAIDGGQVQAWFVPASGDQPAPLVVYFHGNGELVDYQSHIIKHYSLLGFNVLLPEYRGFGASKGDPSQKNIGEDVAAFYDMVIKRPGVDTARVLFHGRSLGGAVAVDLAARRKPHALILDSSFTSMTRMAGRYLVPSFMLRHPYRTDRVLPELNLPTMISHGTHDEIIPVRHGRDLAKMTPNAVFYEYNCMHNDFPGRTGAEQYWQRVTEFLHEAGISSLSKNE
jgi:hypothetical protein